MKNQEPDGYALYDYIFYPPSPRGRTILLVEFAVLWIVILGIDWWLHPNSFLPIQWLVVSMVLMLAWIIGVIFYLHYQSQQVQLAFGVDGLYTRVHGFIPWKKIRKVSTKLRGSRPSFLYGAEITVDGSPVSDHIPPSQFSLRQCLEVLPHQKIIPYDDWLVLSYSDLCLLLRQYLVLYGQAVLVGPNFQSKKLYEHKKKTTALSDLSMWMIASIVICQIVLIILMLLSVFSDARSTFFILMLIMAVGIPFFVLDKMFKLMQLLFFVFSIVLIGAGIGSFLYQLFKYNIVLYDALYSVGFCIAFLIFWASGVSDESINRRLFSLYSLLVMGSGVIVGGSALFAYNYIVHNALSGIAFGIVIVGVGAVLVYKYFCRQIKQRVLKSLKYEQKI